MMRKKMVLAVIATVVICLLLSTPVLAAKGDNGKPDSGVRPGWGYGDPNHDHSGPPGQVNKDLKPGWGYGDPNHDHYGPPGWAD